MAAMEAVLATAITFPMGAACLMWAVSACKILWEMIGSLVGWPHL
jgi:hypothetical protein